MEFLKIVSASIQNCLGKLSIIDYQFCAGNESVITSKCSISNGCCEKPRENSVLKNYNLNETYLINMQNLCITTIFNKISQCLNSSRSFSVLVICEASTNISLIAFVKAPYKQRSPSKVLWSRLSARFFKLLIWGLKLW